VKGFAKKAPAVLLIVLIVAISAFAFAGCGTKTEPEKTVDTVKQQAEQATRDVNLRIIDSAIQMYYAETGEYPTNISQLSKYFKDGKPPTDPMGGTYYIKTGGAEPVAAVQ